MKTADAESKLAGPAGALKSNAALVRAFDLCVRKTRRNIKDLADNPKTWSNAVDGRYELFDEGFFELGNWTTSFFTGMALLAWRETEDDYFLRQTLRLAPPYREKAMVRFLDMHHDAGFLYSLYSVALYKLTKAKAHREVGLAAAQALYQRFNHTGGFIRAWGRLNTTEQDNMAIIDCMMNLPLLYWATLESGDRKFHDAAVRQADTTLNCFIRPDDSVFHAFRFDLNTGRPIGGDNYCGFDVDTHWARGTAWAIYGFALSHRHTGDPKYLDAALRLARKFNAELNSDPMPVWDFRLPKDVAALKDSSAAAVVVCGYLELEKLGAADALMTRTKDSLLHQLCSDAYLNFDESCRGLLRDGQVGEANDNRAKNAYTSWGDYYLMEALDRELHQGETWW
jgi:unsaturated chondroitin disaccharide hydrolase